MKLKQASDGHTNLFIWREGEEFYRQKSGIFLNEFTTLIFDLRPQPPDSPMIYYDVIKPLPFADRPGPRHRRSRRHELTRQQVQAESFAGPRGCAYRCGAKRPPDRAPFQFHKPGICNLNNSLLPPTNRPVGMFEAQKKGPPVTFQISSADNP